VEPGTRDTMTFVLSDRGSGSLAPDDDDARDSHRWSNGGEGRLDVLTKFGLRRWPVLTSIVFTVTAAVNIAQFVAPAVLTHLERTPAGRHGDWWRSGTSLLVQDGGVGGTVSNLLFLVLVGVAAEQIAVRWAWLVAYLGAGAVGEAVAYAWQPTGGGNSIAICGLAALVAVALWRRDGRMPPFGPFVMLLWTAVLLSTWIFAVGVVGLVAAALSNTPGFWNRSYARPLTVGFVVVVGVLLCVVSNIHGAALLAGLVVAFAVQRPDIGSIGSDDAGKRPTTSGRRRYAHR
jgi:membrane associated rhomboid family serine protease